MNNGYLGMVRQWQELFWDRRYSHVDMGQWPDFVKLAEAYGCHRRAADRQDDAGRRPPAAIATEGPVVVDVRVTKEENIVPDDRARRSRAEHGGLSMGEPGTKELLTPRGARGRRGRPHRPQAHPLDPGREQARRPDADRRPVRAPRLQHRHARRRPDRRRRALADHADPRRGDAPDRPGHQAAAQAGQRAQDPRPRAGGDGRARDGAVQDLRRRRQRAARSCRSWRSSAGRSSTSRAAR